MAATAAVARVGVHTAGGKIVFVNVTGESTPQSYGKLQDWLLNHRSKFVVR